MDVITQLLTREPIPLERRCEVPEAVAEVVASLLRKDPAERMASASHVVRALRSCVPEPEGLPDSVGGSRPEHLHVAFAGPEVVHHLRSDPAQVLWRRTGGRPSALRATLSAWVRAGVATATEDGRLRITRDVVDRLLAGMPVNPCRGPTDEGVPSGGLALWTVVDLLEPWASPERLAKVLRAELGEVITGLVELERLGLVVRASVGSEAAGEWFATGTPPRPDGALRFRLLDRVAEVVPPDSNERLRHLVAAGRMDDLPAASLVVARARRAEGRLQEAWVAARAGMVAERRLGAATCAALSLAAEVALDGSMRAELRVVEVEARRRGQGNVAELCRLAQSTLRGGEVREALADLDLRAHPHLARWPDALHAFALQRADLETHASWVDAMEGRVDPEQHMAWRARVCARRGDLRTAASLSEQARSSLVGSRWVAATLNTVALWMDAGVFERAEMLLEEAEPWLGRMRAGTLEAYALHMRRMLPYRRGQALAPDDELVDALRALDVPGWAATVLFTEWAAAWRRGDTVREADLAAWTLEAAVAGSRLQLIAHALAVHTRRLHVSEAGLASRAGSADVPPGVRVQAMAAHISAGGALTTSARDAVLKEARGLDYPPAARRELFSAQEVLQMLERA